MSHKTPILWIILSAVIVSSAGCGLFAKTLSHSLREASHHFQYNEGHSEKGLTTAERRARFEVSGMRSLLWSEAVETGHPPSNIIGL